MNTCESELPRRQSIRLKGYDYSQPGAYFVTICTQNRLCHFGEIAGGEVRLNAMGEMIERQWNRVGAKFLAVQLDEHIVMPNHLHAIVLMVGADPCVCPDELGAHSGAPLHRVVQWLKTMTTNQYIHGVRELGWPPFHGRLWQRNYYERVIRDERELGQVREYILNNPVNWDTDEENPECMVS